MTGMRSPARRRTTIAIGAVAIATLTLAGCAEGGGDDSGDSGSVEGETVSISGGITGIEAENMQKSFDKFTEDTGIIVEYTGDKAFEGNIVTKVQGGDAPDIAIVPQPGLLRTLVGTDGRLPENKGFCFPSTLWSLPPLKIPNSSAWFGILGRLQILGRPKINSLHYPYLQRKVNRVCITINRFYFTFVLYETL